VAKVKPLKRSLTKHRLKEFNASTDFASVKGLALEGTDALIEKDPVTVESGYSDDESGGHVNFNDIGKPVAAEAGFTPFFSFIPSGYSGAIPLNVNNFDIPGGMHDATIADSGTATGTQTSSTLKDTSQSWTVDQYKDFYVKTTGGTGGNRWRKISSNTSDTLTISPVWTVTPDATTTYEITELSTRLTVDSDGVYLAVIQIGYEQGLLISDMFGARIDVNGSLKTVKFVRGSDTTEHEVDLSKLLNLSKDDYIEVQAYQATGSERRMIAGTRLFVGLSKQGSRP